MGEITLNIHGKNYGIACDDGQENRVLEVGRYVDDRARNIASAGAASNENHLLVLTALVLADEVKELRDTLQNARQAGGGFHQSQATVYQGLSPDEQSAIINSIENLANRIDSVTSKLKVA